MKDKLECVTNKINKGKEELGYILRETPTHKIKRDLIGNLKENLVFLFNESSSNPNKKLPDYDKEDHIFSSIKKIISSTKNKVKYTKVKEDSHKFGKLIETFITGEYDYAITFAPCIESEIWESEEFYEEYSIKHNNYLVRAGRFCNTRTSIIPSYNHESTSDIAYTLLVTNNNKKLFRNFHMDRKRYHGIPYIYWIFNLLKKEHNKKRKND